MNWTAPEGTTALIFDCDGTLANTMPVHYRAWTAMLERYGIPFPERRFYELGGVPTAQIISLLAEEQGVLIHDLELMVQQKESGFLEYLDHVVPIPPVFAIAEQYRTQLPLAVASGGYRVTVTRTLERIGVREWFRAIVCAEDTPRHKPHPDVFLEAARQLDAEPAQCIVFEDTDIGLEAARRAGIPGVDIRAWL